MTCPHLPLNDAEARCARVSAATRAMDKARDKEARPREHERDPEERDR